MGDARELLGAIEPESIALSFWSPPYFVGKHYEKHLDFDEWKNLIKEVIKQHFPIMKTGGFLVVNIADILCFKDEKMPRIQAHNIRRMRTVTIEDVLKAQAKHPNYNRYQLAELLGCSEQTIDRRLRGNNVRGGKYGTQTRVKVVGGLIEEWGNTAGFYLYDRRIWSKDPAWQNSPWHTLSYRSVDEFEYIYTFWKPGVTKIDRNRITRKEWSEWGSRGVWKIASVRSNDDHPAKFPLELAIRIIKLLTSAGDIVLDCFIGSGTTAAASILEGRKYIGIEIDEKYVKLAKKNCKRTLQELSSSNRDLSLYDEIHSSH